MITAYAHKNLAAQELLHLPLNHGGDLHLSGNRILKVERQGNDIAVTTTSGTKKFKPWKVIAVSRH